MREMFAIQNELRRFCIEKAPSIHQIFHMTKQIPTLLKHCGLSRKNGVPLHLTRQKFVVIICEVTILLRRWWRQQIDGWKESLFSLSSRAQEAGQCGRTLTSLSTMFSLGKVKWKEINTQQPHPAPDKQGRRQRIVVKLGNVDSERAVHPT
jgi:hypothetical protein